MLVDNDEERVVGRIRSLMKIEDTDGPWLAGVCEITDRPEWLKSGTAASLACKTLQANPGMFGFDVVRKGILAEISVLSPGHRPAEPRARVMTCRPTGEPKPAPAVIRRERQVRAEIDEWLRRCDWNPNVPPEVVLENMRAELQAARRWR